MQKALIPSPVQPEPNQESETSNTQYGYLSLPCSMHFKSCAIPRVFWLEFYELYPCGSLFDYKERSHEHLRLPGVWELLG